MRSQFDKQLAQLHRELIEMGALCEGHRSVLSGPHQPRIPPWRKRSRPWTTEIDRKERDIENPACGSLLQQQPVAGDLRQISAALKMITDMERIGDQADDIAEILLCRAGRPLSAGDTPAGYGPGHHPHGQRERGRLCPAGMWTWPSRSSPPTMRWTAILTGSRPISSTVSPQDVDDGEATLTLLMIAKYYERIGDHATNIAEWVMFSVTGVHKTEAT